MMAKVQVYDPPGGWRYGFPKIYKPVKGESLAATLARDGYPAKEISSIMSNDGSLWGVRFWNHEEEDDI